MLWYRNIYYIYYYWFIWYVTKIGRPSITISRLWSKNGALWNFCRLFLNCLHLFIFNKPCVQLLCKVLHLLFNWNVRWILGDVFLPEKTKRCIELKVSAAFMYMILTMFGTWYVSTIKSNQTTVVQYDSSTRKCNALAK